MPLKDSWVNPQKKKKKKKKLKLNLKLKIVQINLNYSFILIKIKLKFSQVIIKFNFYVNYYIYPSLIPKKKKLKLFKLISIIHFNKK
jgi:hypothetical protein